MNKKIILSFLLILFTTGCAYTPTAIGGEISGPTVEPVTVPSGSVLMQDSFDSPASGWRRINNTDGIMDYNDGVYRIVVNMKNMNLWSTPGKVFNDARIEVDVVTLGGPEINRAGIVCRANDTDLYFFVITSNGYYAVGKTVNEKSTLLGQSAFAQSNTIKTGLAINHLRADCWGSTLSFYVNGFLVSQVSDTTLPSGEAGVTVGTFEEGGADVIFDQFIVLQP